MSEKEFVLEQYPLARCAKFPANRLTALPNRYIVKLAPSEKRFASGNTAAQAWRRAYERILAVTPERGGVEGEGKGSG